MDLGGSVVGSVDDLTPVYHCNARLDECRFGRKPILCRITAGSRHLQCEAPIFKLTG